MRDGWTKNMNRMIWLIFTQLDFGGAVTDETTEPKVRELADFFGKINPVTASEKENVIEEAIEIMKWKELGRDDRISR